MWNVARIHNAGPVVAGIGLQEYLRYRSRQIRSHERHQSNRGPQLAEYTRPHPRAPVSAFHGKRINSGEYGQRQSMEQEEMRQFADEPLDFSRLGSSAALKIPPPFAELVESPALRSQHISLQTIP